MKKQFILMFVVLLMVAMTMPAYAVTSSMPDENTSIAIAGAERINVVGSTDAVFLDGNELFVVEALPIMQAASLFALEPTATGSTNIKIYKTTLTDNEINALDNSIVTPMSGPLTNTKQEQNLMGNIRATLKVTFGRPVYGGYQTLHLCKATGTFQNLRPPPNEGVVAQTSQLFYRANGKRFINGIEDINTTIGFTKNYSTPTFTNVQLMPENTAMYVFGEGAGVTYTLFCTRGVTIEVHMPF